MLGTCIPTPTRGLPSPSPGAHPPRIPTATSGLRSRRSKRFRVPGPGWEARRRVREAGQLGLHPPPEPSHHGPKPDLDAAPSTLPAPSGCPGRDAAHGSAGEDGGPGPTGSGNDNPEVGCSSLGRSRLPGTCRLHRCSGPGPVAAPGHTTQGSLGGGRPRCSPRPAPCPRSSLEVLAEGKVISLDVGVDLPVKVQHANHSPCAALRSGSACGETRGGRAAA